MTTQHHSANHVHGVVHDALTFRMPPKACDCHTHVFGPQDQFPLSPGRAYMPDDASVPDLLKLERQLGIERIVIVHPSPYGTDNRCTVDALLKIGENSRGVAVIDQNTTDAQLTEMHDAGVRGVRLNFETYGIQDPALIGKQLLWTRDRVAAMGWHVQMFTSLAMVASMQDQIRKLGTPVVVDHFAGAKAALGVGQPNLDVLLDLVRIGAVWVKLSAPHRISSEPDCADAGTIVRAFIAANPDRMLWGSDWPHPGPHNLPGHDIDKPEAFVPINDGRALNRLAGWVDDDTVLHKILVDNPGQLYCF